MNTITWIIIALLVVAFVLQLFGNQSLRAQLELANAAIAAEKEMNKQLDDTNDRVVEQRGDALEKAAALEKINAEQRDRILELVRQVAPRPPARMTIAGGMSAEEIAENLNGTESTAILRAVFGHLSTKIVALSDRATDAPREKYETKGETIAGYSSEQRLHDAGGASYLAETLAELQDLAKARESTAERAA